LFGRKDKIIVSQQEEITELKRRLYIAMNKECRQNNHDYFIASERTNSTYDSSYNTTWKERMLECKNCGGRIIDDNRYGDFKYKF